MNGSPFLASGKGTGGGGGLTPEQLDQLVSDGELTQAEADIIAALGAAATPQNVADARDNVKAASTAEHTTTRTALETAKQWLGDAITAARDYLKGFIDTLTGKVDAVKAVVDANSTAIAARATQASVDALAGGTTLAAAKTNIIDAVNSQGTSTRNNADASKAEVKQAITDARDHIEAANWLGGEVRTVINTTGLAPAGWTRKAGAVSAKAWAQTRLVLMSGTPALANGQYCNNSRYFLRLSNTEAWRFDTQTGVYDTLTPWSVASGAVPNGVYADDTWLYNFGTSLVDADVKRLSLIDGTGWESKASLPVPVRSALVARLGADKIAVIGGITHAATSDGTTWTSKVQVYDPAANTYTSFDLPFKGYASRCCEMVDGSIVVAFAASAHTVDVAGTAAEATARWVRVKPDNTCEVLPYTGSPSSYSMFCGRTDGTVWMGSAGSASSSIVLTPSTGTTAASILPPFEGSTSSSGGVFIPNYTPLTGKALAGGYFPAGTTRTGGATGLALIYDSLAHVFNNTNQFDVFKN